jgi:PAS domain S-box-containing protein
VTPCVRVGPVRPWWRIPRRPHLSPGGQHPRTNPPIEARLQRRAIVLLLAVVLCLVGTATFILLQQQAASDAGSRADRLRQGQLDAQALRLGMVVQMTGIRGFASTGIPTLLDSNSEGRQQVTAAVQRLRRAGLRETAELAATLAAITSWERWASAAAVDAPRRPLIDPVGLLEGDRRFDAYRGSQARLETALGRDVSSALAEVSERSRAARLVQLTGGLEVGGVLAFLGLMLLRWTLRPVLRLAEAAEAITAGEPVSIPPTTRRDEVGALSRALVQWQNAAPARQQFFTLALDAHLIAEPSGNLVDVNPAMERITGFTKRELTTRPLGDFIHPDDLEGIGAALGALARGGQVTDHEARMLCRDGSYRTLSWNAAASPASGTLYSVGRDVTEERRIRDALEQQAQLLDLAHDAILVREIGSGGRITYWSRGAEDTYGWSATEAVGRISHELLEPEFPSPLLAEIEEEVVRTGRWHGRLVHRLRDGGRVVVDSCWALRSGATGLPEGYLEVNRDITERTRLEQELRTSNDELARASGAKSEFLARMSHELRTPLNAILGFSQLLEMEMGDRHRDFLQRIQGAGHHLLDLVNGVLDISRVEAGVVRVSIEPLLLAAVIEEASALIRPVASTRGITVSTRCDAAASHVLADLQRLKQVLLNLLSNAVKYNREGGHISVVAGPHDGRVRVAVTDTGPGIPACKLDRLFHPFDRLDAETTGVEGTGLGLALSRHLLTAMDGSISVESSEGGTTFTVDLPAAPSGVDRLPTDALAVEVRPPADRACTVLYVEDNLANLELVEQILRRRRSGGFTILPAMQGRLALELALEHRPDLILLDVHLPDLSGWEVLHRLRAEERTAAIPVIVVSADDTARQVERLLDAGARAYLTKPLDVEEFLAVVDEVLTGPHLVDLGPGHAGRVHFRRESRW